MVRHLMQPIAKIIFLGFVMGISILLLPISPVIEVALAEDGQPKTVKRQIHALESERLKIKKKSDLRTTPTDLMKKLERARRTRRAVDTNIAVQIETLRDLIETSNVNDPDLPRYLLKLGDVYWDKADIHYDRAYDLELENKLFEAEKQGDKKEVSDLRHQQAEHLSKEFQWRQRAIEIYRSIEARFPQYPELDMVFYYLGFQLLQLEMRDDAHAYFIKILKLPVNRYTPDALYHVADYYFEKNDYETALQVYRKVEEFPDAISFSTALYKQGWCLYNIGEYEDSVQAFLRVIQFAKSKKAKNLPYRFELETDAQQDLVRAYAEVADPGEAIEFFGKVAPDLKLTLTEVLAQMLFTKGGYYDSIALYRALEKERRKDPQVAFYWLGIAECAYRVGKPKLVMKMIRQSMSHYRGLSSGPLPVGHKLASHLSRRDRRELYVRLEGLLKTVATAYHLKAEKSQDEKGFEDTAYLYDAYLALFPDSEDAYDITWNVALLNEQMNKWDQAGELYEIVYDMAPLGAHASEAAKAILLAYYNAVQKEETDIKEDETLDLAPKPYPPSHAKVMEAAARFIETSWMSDPEVSKAHFVYARSAYRFNHFSEALPHLKAILEKYPSDPLVPISARMVLSCYSLQRDMDKLETHADTFAKDPGINRGKLAALINSIRDRAGFNRCFRFEKERNFLESARCFEDYVRNFPDTKLKTRAYFHAASAYFKAKLVEKALHNLEDLYDSAPNDPLAPTALFSIAEILRSIAVYSESARVYELYAKFHPKHKHVKVALQRAIVFRKALRDYDQAIENIDRFTKRFRRDKSIARLTIEKAVIARHADKREMTRSLLNRFLEKPPRGINPELLFQAKLELGRTLIEMKQLKKAREVLESAVRLFAGLPYHKKKKVSQSGVATIAESHFLIGQMVLEKMAALKFEGDAKSMGRILVKKLALIKESNKIFARVVRYGNKNWSIAGFARTARAFEDLSRDIISAPIPRAFRGDSAEVYRQTLAEQAQPIQLKAITSYQEALGLAMDLQWFNTFAQDSVEALARLDYEFAFTKEYTLKPDRIRLQGAIPSIESFTEPDDKKLMPRPATDQTAPQRD